MKCGVCGITTGNGTVCEFCGYYILSAPLVSQPDIENYTRAAVEWRNKIADPKQFTIKSDVLEKYTGNSTCVAVPDNVRIIDSHCFARTVVQKVLIPPSIEFIGKDDDEDNNGAFWACPDLEELFFEGNSRLKAIGRFSFYGCSKLKTIRGFSGSVQRIRSHSFTKCPLNPETIRNIQKNTREIEDDWKD
jgi:hypothetical protein